MSSKISNLIIRVTGLVVTALLLIQPWLVKFNFLDPFIVMGWTGIIAAILAISVSSLVLAFYRPAKGFNTLTATLSIIFVAIGISLYKTNYNVCLRVSMIAIGIVACIGSLRLFRKSIDNYSIAGMISLSGFFMAIYAICQFYGHDFLLQSQYQVVGTLTNPNFLGLFLCLTTSISFGLVAEFYKKGLLKNLWIFSFFFLTQFGVIFLLGKSGHLLSVLFMILIWFWSNLFKISGKISRKSPIIVGFFIALFCLGFQWLIFNQTIKYPWNKLTKVPYNAQSFVSRIILWQMGFEIFKEHSLTGAGAGAAPYIMPLKRPPTGSLLGLKIYNDDPHSIVISILAETGFLGLWGFCSLLVAIYGCFARKNTKYEPDIETELILENHSVDDFSKIKKEMPKSIIITTEDGREIRNDSDKAESDEIEFPWFISLIMLIILYLGFQSGFIGKDYIPAFITLMIITFGIGTSFFNNSVKTTKNDFYFLGKSTLVAIFTFVFYGLYNNVISIIPLSLFIVTIISLHFSCCLPDIRFKQRITGISLLFILLPVVYGFLTCFFEKTYDKEQTYLTEGAISDSANRYEDSEKSYFSAINNNPQCLRAYYGLAKALYYQGKAEEAQDIFTQLDSMVPNIYRSKYEIAKISFEKGKILEAHRFAINNLKWAEDPMSYELLGKILLVEGRRPEAEEIFKEGLLAIPANQEERIYADWIRLNLAALAIEKGDNKNSKKYIMQIHSEVSQNINALYIKGMIFIFEKKYDEALEIFEEALKSYSHIPRILNATGYVLTITNKDLDRAQILLETAYDILKQDQQSSKYDYLMVANSLGKLYLKQNKLQQAGELLKLSYEETPDELKELKAERLKDLNDFYNSFSKAE